ncbi:MAG: 3-hydroxyanthranilate 3,4-dioxygenase [Phycisphaerales bacterium]|nr:3-hydroxyanthranilate 3,4-dioxygenase [Phycisphaerales bacterium]
MSIISPVNLKQWVEENRHHLKPPVGNKVVWQDETFIIMVVGGPNARKDYHVNETSEFFYQVQGDITVGIIHPDTGKPEEVVIREGEIFLLPPKVPHSPRRPANTVGVVVEQTREPHHIDKLQFYSDDTHELVYEAEFKLENIAVDLKRIMEEFWSNEDLRRCPSTGSIIAPPTEAQPPVKA